MTTTRTLATTFIALALLAAPASARAQEPQKAAPAAEAAAASTAPSAEAAKPEGAQGEAAQFSPEWISVMLEAGRRIRFRPYQAEAVAPDVRPDTAPTRDLSALVARALALLDRTEAGARAVRLLGVSVHNFSDTRESLPLFDQML